MTTIHTVAATTKLHTMDTAVRDEDFEVIITIDQRSPFYRLSAVSLLTSLLYMGIGRCSGGTAKIELTPDSHQIIVSASDPSVKHLAAEIVHSAIAEFRRLGAL